MRSVFGKLKARVVAGIGSAAAVCGVAIYSILGAAPPPDVPEYAAGSRIEAGQWQVVPRRAWLARQTVHGVRLQEGEQALVLELELSNRTRASSRDYSELLQWQALPGVPQQDPEVALVRDARPSPLLHPGLGERVAYVWKLPATATPPARLEAEVIAKTYKPVDNLYGTPGWFNPRVVGRLSLALDEPAAAGGPQRHAS